MTTPPPEPRPTTQAGQRELTAQERADELIAAINEALPQVPAFYKDESETPKVGDAAPHEQPGRPAMSQKGMDDSVRLICFGGSAFLVCGGVAIVMVASDHADPTAIGSFFGGLAILVLALRALVAKAKRLVPDEHHHHHNGPIYQDNRQDHSTNTTHNKWWGHSSTEKEKK